MRSEGGFFAFEDARVCCSKSPAAAAAARRDWRAWRERERESANRRAVQHDLADPRADCAEPIDFRVLGPKTAAISHFLSVASIPAIRRKAERRGRAAFLIAPEERAALDAVTLRMPVSASLPVCLAATLPDSSVPRPPGPSEETRAKLAFAAQTRHNPEAPHLIPL